MSPTGTLTQSTAEAPARKREIGLRYRLKLDPWLLIAVIGLSICSVVTIKGATVNDIPGNPYHYFERQLIYVVVGMVLMLVISRIDYTRLKQFKYVAYGFLMASILLVFLLSTATRGSKRWIELPFFRFQPSELGKLLLVISIAAFVVDRQKRGTGTKRATAEILFLAFLPALLVMAQPDLGTALTYVVGVMAILYFAGMPWRHLGTLAATGVCVVAVTLLVAPAVNVNILKPYQIDRLTSFIHPSGNPSKEGWQQQQSKIAIGSGEKTGRGEVNATQTALNFLPEHHTDFIFAVVGETYGFAGAAFVLSLYALLIWRGLRTLLLAKNLFGALLAGGITVMLLYQTFVNVGMTAGIMPITGVTAPLLSFGGSSILVTFMAIGLLQSVHAHSHTGGRNAGLVAT